MANYYSKGGIKNASLEYKVITINKPAASGN